MNPEAAQFDIDSDIRWLSSKTIRPATRSFRLYYYSHARLHSIAPSLFTLNQTLLSHVVAISIHCSLFTGKGGVSPRCTPLSPRRKRKTALPFQSSARYQDAHVALLYSTCETQYSQAHRSPTA